MKKKYTMTLLEVMIVIFIIGIIGSVVGYNMRGSLDSGKAFKTKEGIRKIYEVVQLEIAQNEDAIDPTTALDDKLLRPLVEKILKNSGLIKNVGDLMKDGWGNPYHFDLEEGDIRLHSVKYDTYCSRKGVRQEYPWD